MDEAMSQEEAFELYRVLLFSIAYRMTGERSGCGRSCAGDLFALSSEYPPADRFLEGISQHHYYPVWLWII